MSGIKSILLALWAERPTRWALFIILGALLISLMQQSPRATTVAPAAAADSEDLDMDTFIPAGFVLVPVQLQNIEALQAMIGAYALVDLYSEGQTQSTAQGLRLIRSPRDPSQMAVLVPQALSPKIVQAAQKPLLAVVQNRQSQTPQSLPQRKGRLIWEDPL